MITLTVATDYTTIIGIPAHIKEELRMRLRYLSASATSYNPAYASGRWDGYIPLFDSLRYRFPSGLFYDVLLLLKRHNLEYEVRTALPEFQHYAHTFDNAGVKLRPYQVNAVTAITEKRRGSVRIPTGGGKTLVAVHAFEASKQKALLFVVPNRVLLNQTYKIFKRHFPSTPVYKWGDDTKAHDIKEDVFILITTVQTAVKKIEEHSNVFQKIGMVIVDEAHHIAATTFKATTKACTSARYIIGLSATPFRDDGADMELTAWLGPEIYSIDYAFLIANGFLVPPTFKRVSTIKDAIAMVSGRKPIFFSEKKAELLEYGELFRHAGIKILTGSNSTAEIREALTLLGRGELPGIAATPIFDEGLDETPIDCVVFFATGKSHVRALQRIGRAMRPAPGKVDCLVVDVMDKGYPSRVKAYCREPAFAAHFKK
jgi:superfamily II DNA or RNA helicase